MRWDAEITGKTDITAECNGKWKIWAEVYNVNHNGDRTGGTHYSPITPQEFANKTQARRALAEYRRELRRTK
jgi:hypothetical protein